MNNFLRLPHDDGCYFYVNLDKVISIQFDKEKNMIIIYHDTGNIENISTNIEIFEEKKKIIDEEMEKRMLQKSEV